MYNRDTSSASCGFNHQNYAGMNNPACYLDHDCVKESLPLCSNVRRCLGVSVDGASILMGLFSGDADAIATGVAVETMALAVVMESRLSGNGAIREALHGRADEWSGGVPAHITVTQ